MDKKPEIHLNINDSEQMRAFDFTLELAQNAEVTSDFVAKFWNALVSYKDVYEEFLYYMKKKDFLCKVKIEGYTLVDIMIYQVDHFKAALDRVDLKKYKHNGEFMVLMAFNTLLEMKENPSGYVYKMQHESGTDSENSTV